MSLSNQTALAKIRAIYGNMLKEKEYLEILNCNNVLEIFNHLQSNENYKSSLKLLNKAEIKRYQIEGLIKKNAFENYAKIFRYASKNVVIGFVVEYFEMIEILKTISRINLKDSKENVFFLPPYLILKCKIDLYKLKKIETFEELLNFLKNTRYLKILKDIEIKNNEINFKECEHKLYDNFFKRLLKTVKNKTKNVELFELNSLIKTKLDHLNLCYIYREKILFNSDEKKIEDELFPYHKNLNSKYLSQILDCKTKMQLEETLKKIYPVNQNLKIEDIEKYCLKLEYKKCKNKIHLSLNITTVFYCFFILQQVEILNLTYLIEGISYNLPKNEIKNLLII